MQNLRLLLMIIASLPLRRFFTMQETQLLKILEQNKFQGTWKSMNQSENQFNFFNDVQEGNVEIKFNDKNFFLQNYVTFIFQNSQYRENKNVIVKIPLQNYNDSLMYWSSTTNLDLKGEERFRNVWEEDCLIQYIILVEFTDKIYDAMHSQINVYFKSQTSSKHCNFSIISSSNLKVDENKNFTWYYCTILILLLIQLVVAGILAFRIIKYNYILKKIQSFYLITFWKLSVSIYYFIFFLFCLMFQLQEYQDSIILWAVYISAIYQMLNLCQFYTFIPLIKEKLQKYHKSSGKVAQIVALIITSILILSIIIIFLMFYFIHQSLVIFMLGHSFILFPEIIYNVKYNTKPYFNLIFIFLEIFPELYFIIYIKGCPTNIYSTQPNYILITLYLIIFITSFIILLCQNIFGPRFQMFKEVIKSKQQKLWKCFICFNSFRYIQSIEIFEKIYIPLQTTPCNHRFHQLCLEEWLKLKQICPYCETDLQQ